MSGSAPVAPYSGAPPTFPERLISGTLRGGVMVSFGLIVLGWILSLVQEQGPQAQAELARLMVAGEALPQTLGAVVAGVRQGHGLSIVALGLLVLIATPVVRVAVSILVFMEQRDRLYTAITAGVLLLLLLSFLLGAPGH